MKAARKKELQEQSFEFRQWQRWRRERLEALLAGPYGESTQALLAFCKTMATPSAVLDFIACGPWSDADINTRAEILSLVDAMIIKRRERMGLPPFDDALPGAPSNLFLLLRERLAPPPGAEPGSIDSTPKIQEHVT
jgi:hypothetical protein